MKCSNTIVPGFEQTNKIKNPGLETKIEKDINTANKPFKQESLDRYTKYDAQELSEGKILYMSPDDFLALAAPLFYGDKEVDSYYAEQIKEGNKMDIPYLNATYNDKTGDAKIIGHEGRHRAETLRKQNVKLMPVRFRMVGREGVKFEDIWWKDLGNMRTEFGRKIRKYPRRLFNEEGTASYSFPVSKNKVKDNNIKYKLKNKTEFTAGRMSLDENVLHQVKRKRAGRLINKRLQLQKMLDKATLDDWEWLSSMSQKDWHIYWNEDTETFTFPEASSQPIPKELRDIIG